MNRSKLLLALLLLVFAGVLVSSYLRYPRQKTVARLTYAPGASAPAVPRTPKVPSEPAGSAQPLDLRIDFLAAPVAHSAVKRDLLKPLSGEGNGNGTARKTAAAKLKPLPPPPPPPPPTAEEIARQQLAQFKLLGLLKKNDRATVFLSRGSEILLVRVGDTPVTGFRVHNIASDRLVLRAVNGTEELVWPLR